MSALSLLVSLAVAIARSPPCPASRDCRCRQRLYPALWSLRDSPWEYGKVLGGQNPHALVALNGAVRDLVGLHPAIEDQELAAIIEDIFKSDAVSLALSIDPARFTGAVIGDELLQDFVRVSQRGQDAIHRAQALRRRVGS